MVFPGLSRSVLHAQRDRFRRDSRHQQEQIEERKRTMKPTQQLHDLGQSLWLDNITRELLTGGTLRRYRDEFSVTGLTSNPTIFDLAIRNGNAYDESIRSKAAQAKSSEQLF